MIIKQYIKDFEKLGFGMFVHFGAYSVYGHGEWAKSCLKISDDTYRFTADVFDAYDMVPWIRSFYGRIKKITPNCK